MESKDKNPLLNQDWLKIQQQYLELLTALGSAQDKSNVQISDNSVLEQVLTGWQQAIAPALPDDSRGVFDNLVKQSKVFHSFVNQFARFLSEMSGVDQDSDDWQKILARHFKRMKAELARNKFVDNEANGFINPWLTLLEAWQQMIATMNLLPVNGLQGLMGGAAAGKLQSLPGFGPAGKFYEKIQHGIHLWERYQEKLKDYYATLMQTSINALSRLEEKIIELGKAKKKISSLREFYDLWVDCNEEVFTEYLAGDAHSRLYAQLLEALMLFKKYSQEAMDETLDMFKVPTEKTMETVRGQQHDLERELHNIGIWREEIAGEVERLRGTVAQLYKIAEKTKEQKKKTVRRKKTRRKKHS